MPYKTDGDFLLYWSARDEYTDEGGPLREGVIRKASVTKIELVVTSKIRQIEIVLGDYNSRIILSADDEECRNLLSWYYGKPFPPREIGKIEDPAAYAKAYESWQADR